MRRAGKHSAVVDFWDLLLFKELSFHGAFATPFSPTAVMDDDYGSCLGVK